MNDAPSSWSVWQKRCLSVILIGYLTVVLLGPLTVPFASEHLTRPLGQLVEPIQQALFLRHGYRFFGPDPGPSHIVKYKITQHDSSPLAGTFPDRESQWPRLRYHRWFMLSETLYSDAAGMLSEKEHAELIENISLEIDDLRLRRETAVMDELVLQRTRIEEDREFRQVRLENSLQHLANHLLFKHGGKDVEIFLHERLIPNPTDVQSRIRLSDSRFLSEPRSLGIFKIESTFGLEQIQ